MRNKEVLEAYLRFRRKLAQGDPTEALAELQAPSLPGWLRHKGEGRDVVLDHPSATPRREA